MWTTTGSPSSVRHLELAFEQTPLLLRRGEAANVVEPGLADSDRLRMAKELCQLVEPGGVVGRSLVRVDSEGRIHAGVLVRDR